MKTKYVSGVALLMVTAHAIAFNFASIGDDGNPTTQGNGAYNKNQTSTPVKATAQLQVKATASEHSVFKSQVTTLCINNLTPVEHTFQTSGVNLSQYWSSSLTPEQFNGKTIRPYRKFCKTIYANGDAKFSLSVDGKANPLFLIRVINDPLDPSDSSSYWGTEMNKPLSGITIEASKYKLDIAGILDSQEISRGNKCEFNGCSELTITGKNL